jgi:hypothetical protein
MKTYKDRTLFLIFGILSIFWLTVIFVFSNCNADESSDQSSFFADIIIRLFYPDFSDLTEIQRYEIVDKITYPIRKTAHFTIYMVLGVLTYFFFYFHNRMRDFAFPKAYTMSIPICFLYACSDEFHQLFIDGRSGNLTDILIDTSGAVLSTLLAIIVLAIIAKVKKNHEN